MLVWMGACGDLAELTVDAVRLFDCAGMTSQEAQGLWDLLGSLKFFKHHGNIPEPIRLPDLIGHIRAFNLPEPPLPGECVMGWVGERRYHTQAGAAA